MSENLFQTTGTFTPDRLIADNAIPITTKGIKVAKGEGLLKRGTLMGPVGDGTYKRTGSTEGIVADCILTDDVAAMLSDAVTTAYVSGTFNRAAVVLPEGKDIADYETELRKLGIFLKAVQEY